MKERRYQPRRRQQRPRSPWAALLIPFLAIVITGGLFYVLATMLGGGVIPTPTPTVAVSEEPQSQPTPTKPTPTPTPEEPQDLPRRPYLVKALVLLQSQVEGELGQVRVV
ncbi:MAG TPA: hypothetical protein EYP25_14010, partial [Anaerolineae bacterium]|nr:hypothetical protein [Anaerolineae bacterium]